MVGGAGFGIRGGLFDPLQQWHHRRRRPGHGAAPTPVLRVGGLHRAREATVGRQQQAACLDARQHALKVGVQGAQRCQDPYPASRRFLPITSPLH